MRILGINSDVDTCESCGKSGLKRVIWLLKDDGSVVHYGTDCAGMALLGRKNAGNTKTTTERAQIVETGKRWLRQGHSLETVKRGLWNRFGYPVGIKDGKILLGPDPRAPWAIIAKED